MRVKVLGNAKKVRAMRVSRYSQHTSTPLSTSGSVPPCCSPQPNDLQDTRIKDIPMQYPRLTKRPLLPPLFLIIYLASLSLANAQPFANGYRPQAQGGGGGSGAGPMGAQLGTPSSITVPATDTDGSYPISWNSVGLAQYYELQERYNSGNWTTYTVFGTSQNYNGKADGNYQYQVRACTDNPQYWEPCGAYRTSGTTLQVQRTPGQPASVTIPSSTVTGNYAISWGSASGTVSRYEYLEYRNGGQVGNWTSNGMNLSKSFSSQTDGNYFYKVRACNTIAGCGSDRQSATFTVLNIPGTPASITVPGTTKGQYSLSWGDATGQINHYEYAESYNSTWGSWTNHNLNKSLSYSNKANGTYQYRTRACNSMGCGTPLTSNSFNVINTPQLNSNAQSPADTDREVSFNWDTTGLNLGLVDHFRVERQHAGGAWGTVTTRPVTYLGQGQYSVDTQLLQQNLLDGNWTYRLWLCTSPSNCQDDPSQVSFSVQGTPGTPTNVLATLNSSTITVTWNDATGTVEYYELRSSSNGGGSWSGWQSNGTSKNKAISVQTSGQYRYEVRACNNGAGCGPLASSNTLTLNLSPAVTLTAGNPDTDRSITVNWSTSGMDLSLVAFFEIQRRHQPNGGNWSGWSGGGSINVVNQSGVYKIEGHAPGVGSLAQTNLADGRWSFRLTFYDHQNTQSPAGAEAQADVLGPPGAPANPVATLNNGNDITLTWNDATGQTDRYEWRESQNGNWSTWTDNGSAKNKSLLSKINGTYRYEIRAYNAIAGYGPVSTSNSITLRLAPALQSSAQTPYDTDGAYTLNWPYTQLDLSQIDAFQVTYTHQPPSGASTSGLVIERSVHHQGSSHTVDQSAVNQSGKADGLWTYQLDIDYLDGSLDHSAPLNVNVLRLPSFVTNLTAHQNGERVQLNWGQAGGSVDRYEWCAQSCSSWTSTGLNQSASIALQNDGNYQYQVRACNAAGCGSSTAADVLFSLAASADAPWYGDTAPVTGNGNVGALEGSGGVSGGAATYSIPLSVPPGRKNRQPALSLNYSSRSGNGLLGQGWNLSAGGAIHRCASIYSIDGYSRNVQLDAQDRLCLNGERLKVYQSNYGTAGSTYHPETDPITRVTLYGDMASPSAWFKVEYKTGLREYYGQTSQARLLRENASVTSSWLLERSEDPALNQIDYTYNPLGDPGNRYLTLIEYTGHNGTRGDRRITFDYQTRPDKHSDYLRGTRAVRSQRLIRIQTHVGYNAVAEYTLNYRPINDTDQLSYQQTVKTNGQLSLEDQFNSLSSDDLSYNAHRPAQKTLLKSIQQCNWGNQNQQHCLPATELTTQAFIAQAAINTEIHSRSDGAHYPSLNQLGYSGKITPLLDMDGDGAPDLAQAETDRYTYGESILQLGTYDRIWLTRTQQTVDLPAGFLPLGEHIETEAPQRDLVTDWNLDGRKDLLGRYITGNGEHRLAIAYWNPQTGTLQRKDFPGINVACAATYWLPDTLSLTGGMEPFWEIAYRNCNSYVLDANGDGKDDLVIATRQPTPEGHASRGVLVTWQLYLHCGTNSAPDYCPSGAPIQVETNNNIQVTDFEGDGTPDLIGLHGGKSANDLTPVHVLKTVTPVYSGGEYQLQITDRGGVWSNQNPTPLMLDANGDGLLDLLIPAGIWKLRTNQGNGIFTETTVNLPNVQRTGIVVEGAKYLGGFSRMIDYNRDGLTDLIIPKQIKYAAVCTHPSSGPYSPCDRTRQYESYSLSWMERAAETHFIFDYYDLYAWGIYEAYLEPNGNLNYREVSNPGIDIVASLIDLNVIDYNLDGAEDLITRYGRGGNTGFTMHTAKPAGLYVYANPNAQADLLTQAEDALGRKSRFGYQALYQISDATTLPAQRFYDLNLAGNNSAQFPNQTFGTATQMVALYQNSDGLGGLRNTELQYRDARYHLQGRGFQGFKTIIETHRALNTRSKTNYLQDFPLSGRVAEQWQYATNAQSDEQQISYTENSWRSAVQQNAYLLYSDFSATQHRDLESGDVLYRTETNTQVDAWGNPTDVEAIYAENNNANRHQTNTQTLYHPADETNWWLDKIDTQTVTRQAVANRSADNNTLLAGSDEPHQTQTVYDPLWHPSRQPQHLSTQALQGAGRAAGLITTLDTNYNDHGLPTTLTTGGMAANNTPLSARTIHTTYSADGYFIQSQTNALGHTTTYQTDPRHGQVTQITDPNGLITRTDYDAFGRTYRQQAPGEPSQYTTYVWCNGIQSGSAWCPDYDHANYRIGTRQTGKPDTYRYYDNLNREVRSLVDNYTASDYYQVRTTYNAKGQKTLQSEPYNFGVDPDWTYTHYDHYDGLGRLTQKRAPQAHGGDITITYAYHGFTTAITAQGNNTLNMSRTYNGLGQLLNTTDADGNPTRYTYNGAGQPITLSDAAGNRIYSHYNALGHKEWIQDPDMGRKDFGYNSLGELETETDANGNTQHYTYDRLGRLRERRTNGSLSGRWTYDDPSEDGGLGLLRSETSTEIGSPHRYEKTYTYTQAQSGRKVPYRTQHRIIEPGSNQTWDIYRYTDSHYGRPTGVYYAATGLSVHYDYTDQGYLKTVRNAADGHIYQHITAMDARGHITARQLNNDQLQETRNYLAATGQLGDNTVTWGTQTQHELIYSYDGFNNLNDQTVTVQNGAMNLEHYQYDQLHRLINSTRSLNNPGTSNTDIHYSYDAVGNFTQKSDFANTYTYGDASRSQNNAGPHAVWQVQKPNGQTINYHYDNNGNLLSGDGKTLNYNAFNKPTNISKNGLNSSFQYGADLQRYRHQKSGAPGSITYYLDELEIEYKGNEIIYRHPIGDVALHTKMVQAETQASHWALYYTLRDRLGSVVTLTDSSGAIVEHRSYDPFGKPRRGDFADASRATLQASILEDPHAASGAPKTPRGFTDHEHMDDQELIHMNGRVYDYNLGRFLSVDPFIQAPGNSQSINPYSYILNNPLSGTDPSGYMYRNTVAPARPGPGEDAPLVNVVSACFATACTENHIKTDGITVNKSNGADTRQTHVAKTSLSAQKTAPASGLAGPAGSKVEGVEHRNDGEQDNDVAVTGLKKSKGGHKYSKKDIAEPIVDYSKSYKTPQEALVASENIILDKVDNVNSKVEWGIVTIRQEKEGDELYYNSFPVTSNNVFIVWNFKNIPRQGRIAIHHNHPPGHGYGAISDDDKKTFKDMSQKSNSFNGVYMVDKKGTYKYDGSTTKCVNGIAACY